MAKEQASIHDEPHRDVQGGMARAAVFGVNDGLVSNVSLILGMAGASATAGVVRLAGIAGLLAGAFSMAAGEYVSMKAQEELLARELERERRELARNPQQETRELALIYQRRGVPEAASWTVAEAIMEDPATALEVHAREEMGIDPEDLGSPIGAALSSLVAFSGGAFVPLVPWFVSTGTAAVLASILLAVLAAVAIGWVLARFTGRSRAWSVTRQVGIATVAAAVTYGVGAAIGVGIA